MEIGGKGLCWRIQAGGSNLFSDCWNLLRLRPRLPVSLSSVMTAGLVQGTRKDNVCLPTSFSATTQTIRGETHYALTQTLAWAWPLAFVGLLMETSKYVSKQG